MPRLVRWFIKGGLIYLVMALIAGFLLQARTVMELPSWTTTLHPIYIHLLTVGWITQLIIGVAYWMFPKFSREHPHGSEFLGWATFVLLNSGLFLRILSEPRVAMRSKPDLGWVLALSAVLQMVAGWLFVVNIWLRVKER